MSLKLGTILACMAGIRVMVEAEDKPKFFGDICDVWVHVPGLPAQRAYQQRVLAGKRWQNIGLLGRRLPFFVMTSLSNR